jgi:hypothetical protein
MHDGSGLTRTDDAESPPPTNRKLPPSHLVVRHDKDNGYAAVGVVGSSSSCSDKINKMGYYADPYSPIASTPMKRQRTSAACDKDDTCMRRLEVEFDEERTSDGSPYRRPSSSSSNQEKDAVKTKPEPKSTTTATTLAKHSLVENSGENNNNNNELNLFSPALKVDKEKTVEDPGSNNSCDDSSLVEVEFNPCVEYDRMMIMMMIMMIRDRDSHRCVCVSVELEFAH